MNTALTVSWNAIDRAEWDRAHAQVCAAYQQDWAYGEALAGAGAQVLRAVVRRPDGALVALAQVTARPFALVARFALCTHGPVWMEGVSAADKRAAYRALKKSLPLSWPRLLVLTPDEARDAEAGLGGMSRVMSGAATVRIDLSQDEDALRRQLDGKWRNRLVAAEKSDLKYVRGGAKPAQYQWLLNAEESQRGARGYRALPAAMTLDWQAAKAQAPGADKTAGVAICRADLGRDTAGAMLFLIHGRMATYHIGWSSEDGRRLGAHNLVLWRAMLDLKAQGVACLDLGGVNTQSGAGIARFKLGAGGDVLERAGAYV